MLPVAALALAFAIAPPPPDQLAHLAKLYQAYDLPLPPKDAKLYRYDSSKTIRPDGPPRIGFGVRPKPDGSPAALLVGCSEESAYPKLTAEIQPDPKTINPAEVSLPTAIHFQLRGWHELAEAVFAAGGNWKAQSPSDVLASRAFGYWQGQLLNPAVDRAKIVRRLAVILSGEPEAFSKASREWYDDLLLSLKPTGAKPGSAEADIDELIDASGGDTVRCVDPRYFAVAARGFDAVPALIAHLSDARPTRLHRGGGGGFGLGRETTRVKHLASDILIGFMHDDEYGIETDKDGVIRVKDAKAWWAKTSKMSEETYAVTRVLKAADDAGGPNSLLLRLIQHKYPERLPEVFHILLGDRPKMGLYEMAGAVADSTLPKETKRKLFLEAATADFEFRKMRNGSNLGSVVIKNSRLLHWSRVPEKTDKMDEREAEKDRSEGWNEPRYR